MERVFGPLFVVVVLVAFVSLDFFSKRNGDDDGNFTVADYIDLRTAPFRSTLAAVTEDQPEAFVPADGGQVAEVQPVRAVALAVGALTDWTDDPNVTPETASAMPSALAMQAAMMFAATSSAVGGEAAMPIDTSLDAGTLGASIADDGSTLPAPAPSMMKPAARLTDKSCATKAGTKFCSVATD